MLTPRWRKVLSDLWSNKARTLLAAMSIAVGILAVGSVSGVYFIIQEDVAQGYLSVNPHAGMIYTSLFDDDLLEVLRRTEGVKQVEGRSAASGQVALLNGQKVATTITGIPPLSTIQIDQIALEQGSADLKFKEIYVERGAQAALGIRPGDTIQIELPDGHIRDVRVAGIVHDVNANPFTLVQQVSAYADLETMEWLGGTRLYSQMMFTVSERPFDEEHVRNVAKTLEEKISRSGNEAYLTVVFRPGQHPAQQTIDGILVLMGGMGVLALFLSTFLVINTITALLGQQIRQIGVMKAIGATMGQVAGIYLILILAFGVIALLIAVPLSAALSYLCAVGIGALLNIDISGFRIPPGTLALEIFVGLAVPLFAGSIPVVNGARLTVREAISNYGLSISGTRGWFDRVLENVRGLPRPLLISLRNTFRRKARLALTLFTLILGGGIFIAVFNLQASLYNAIDVTLGYVLSDVNVSFQRSYRIERIQEALKDMPGVVKVEGWGDMIGQADRPDGKTSDQLEIIAPPPGSNLIVPVLTSGRWLVPGDENAVVVGNHFMKVRPDVQVGDEIVITINERDYPFKVVGIYQMAGNVLMPVVYINFDYLAKLINQPGQVYALRVVTELHDAASQDKAAKALEARFNQAGIAVNSIMAGSVVVQQNRITIDILVYLLMFMAILIAVVGGLGLMGTMSMNVLERTREIGVMRSIGAVDTAIMQLVIVEGMVIGIISWVLGALLSIPIARGLGYILGVTLLNVPLDYRFSLAGLIIWVIVVLVLSALACIIPARNAIRLTVRDVLAYE